MQIFDTYWDAEVAYCDAAAGDVRWELDHCYAEHALTGRGAVLTLDELDAARSHWIEPRSTMGHLHPCIACDRLVVGPTCDAHAEAVFDR